MNFFKKIYGAVLWKTEEAKRLVSIFFWVLTLSGIYLPYISHEIDQLGFHLEGYQLFGLLCLIGFLAILIVGHITDKLRLWSPDWQAKIQRQPFQIKLLTPKEQKILANQARLFEGLRKGHETEDFEKAIKELKGWAEKGEV